MHIFYVFVKYVKDRYFYFGARLLVCCPCSGGWLHTVHIWAELFGHRRLFIKGGNKEDMKLGGDMVRGGV